MAEATEVTGLFLSAINDSLAAKHRDIEHDAALESKAQSIVPLTDHDEVLELMKKHSIDDETTAPLEGVLFRLSVVESTNPVVEKLRADWTEYTRHVRAVHYRSIKASVGIDAGAFNRKLARVTFDTCFESPLWDHDLRSKDDFPTMCRSMRAPIPSQSLVSTPALTSRMLQRRHLAVVGMKEVNAAVQREEAHHTELGHYRAAESISRNGFRFVRKAARLCLEEAGRISTPAFSGSSSQDTSTKRMFVDLVQTTYTQLHKALTVAFKTVRKEDVVEIIDDFLKTAAARARTNEVEYSKVDIKSIVRDVDLKTRIVNFNKEFLAKLEECVLTLESDTIAASEVYYASVCPWYTATIKDAIVPEIRKVTKALDTETHTISVADRKHSDECKAKLIAARNNVAYIDWHIHVRDTLTRIRELSVANTESYQGVVLKILSAPVTIETSSHPTSDALLSLEQTEAHRSIGICNTTIIKRAREWAEQLLGVINTHFATQEHDLENNRPPRLSPSDVWTRCGGYRVVESPQFEAMCGAEFKFRVRTVSEYRTAWTTVIQSTAERSVTDDRRHSHDGTKRKRSEEIDDDDGDGNDKDGRRVRYKTSAAAGFGSRDATTTALSTRLAFASSIATV